MPEYLESRYDIGDADKWSRHIAEPFSAESLGDPHKPYLTIEGLSFPSALCRFDVPDLDWNIGIDNNVIKRATEAHISRTCVSNVCSRRLAAINYSREECTEPDLANPLHIAFEGLALRILGERAYTQSRIDLTLWRKAVKRGRGQLPIWHLDTTSESLEGMPKDEIGLVGLLTDTLPAQVLLNSTSPDDYNYGSLQSVMGVPLDQANLKVLTLRPNTLTVMPLSIPHCSQTATERIPRRHFMRWHVYDEPRET